MKLTGILRNRKGFTYAELIAGTTILLMLFITFLVMYRYISINRTISREMSSMAVVAQNIAEVYKAYSGENHDTRTAALISEAITEGNYVLVEKEPSEQVPGNVVPGKYVFISEINHNNMTNVTIKIFSPYSFRDKVKDPKYVDYYTLSFLLYQKT